MGDLLKAVIGIFTGGAGGAVGGAVSLATQVAAVLAAVAPIGVFLYGHGDEIALQLTWKALAFDVAQIGVILFLVVRLVHRAPPP